MQANPGFAAALADSRNGVATADNIALVYQRMPQVRIKSTHLREMVHLDGKPEPAMRTDFAHDTGTRRIHGIVDIGNKVDTTVRQLDFGKRIADRRLCAGLRVEL